VNGAVAAGVPSRRRARACGGNICNLLSAHPQSESSPASLILYHMEGGTNYTFTALSQGSTLASFMNLWNSSGLGVQQTEFDTTDAAGKCKVGTESNTKGGPWGSWRVIEPTLEYEGYDLHEHFHLSTCHDKSLSCATLLRRRIIWGQSRVP